MSETTKAVLVVDDSAIVRMTIGELLEDAGFEVVEAASLTEARAQLGSLAFDLVVVDLNLDDGLGTDLIPEIRRRLPAARVALLTGDDAQETGATATGADCVLLKTTDADEMLRRLTDGVGAR